MVSNHGNKGVKQSLEWKEKRLSKIRTCKVIDMHGQMKCYYEGYTYVYWDKNHNCYKVKIRLYDSRLIMHELKRVYEIVC